MNRIRALLVPMLRGVLRSRPVATLTVALAALAVPVAVLGGALPANAVDNNNHLCETFGHQYCAAFTSPTTDAYIVEQKPGRDVTMIDLSSNTIKIEANANLQLCIAAANNGHDVKLHACNGGDGTIWIKHPIDSTHFMLESQADRGHYLAGPNNGSRYQVLPPGVPGWNYSFHMQ